MAPEYAMFGKFSIKSDVFSFGVLILEIISSQKITSLVMGRIWSTFLLCEYEYKRVEFLFFRKKKIIYENVNIFFFNMVCLH